MKCHVCGAAMERQITDLPFKVESRAIVIIKDLPVVECAGCREFLLEDSVLQRVEEILAAAGKTAELEVIRFAA